MSSHRHPTPRPRRPAGFRAGWAGLIALLIAVLGLAAGFAYGRGDSIPAAPVSATQPSAVPGGGSPQPAATDGFVHVPTDRAVKSKLLDALPRAPQVLIFGGSRAARFEPAYLERLTGLRGFNLAFQNGRPEDAWAYVNDARRRWPGRHFRVVWFLQVEAFRDQTLSPGLVQDPRLARWFPASLLAAARVTLPRTRAEAPKGRDLALTRFGPDGVVLRNRYDLARERGRTLERAVAWSISTALERYATTDAELVPSAQKYFEKTLHLVSRTGGRSVVVLMPLHPQLLHAVEPAGWGERHRELLRYLRSVQPELEFALLDFSDLSEVGGDPAEYYDGFHITRATARVVLDAVAARAPQAFR